MTKVIVAVLTMALVGGGVTAAVIAARSGEDHTADSSSVEEIEEVEEGNDTAQDETDFGVMEEENLTDLTLGESYVSCAEVITQYERVYGEGNLVYDGDYIYWGIGTFLALQIDFNGDGLEELVIGVGEQTGNTFKQWVDIWAWENGYLVEAATLDTLAEVEGSSVTIAEYNDGTAYMKQGEVWGDGYSYTYYGYEDGEFQPVLSITHNSGSAVNIAMTPDGEEISYEEYQEYMDKWHGGATDNGELTYWMSLTFEELLENTLDVTQQTKAALGLSTSTASDQTDTVAGVDADTAQTVLENVLNEYSQLISGQLSYFDFVGEELTYGEGNSAWASDYFVTIMNSGENAIDEGCFDEETGYFRLSNQAKKAFEKNGYLKATFYDINGDEIPELIIQDDRDGAAETIAIWSMHYGSPKKIISASEDFGGSKLAICSGGVVLQYHMSGTSGYYYFDDFESMLKNTYTTLDQQIISRAESIWDYTDYVSVEDQLEWTAISIS